MSGVECPVKLADCEIYYNFSEGGQIFKTKISHPIADFIGGRFQEGDKVPVLLDFKGKVIGVHDFKGALISFDAR